MPFEYCGQSNARPFRTSHSPRSAADGARGNSAPIAIKADRIAVNRPPRDEGVEIVGSLRAASILITVLTSAELRALRRVDTPKANAVAVDFDCVAVNNGRLPDQVVGHSRVA